MLLQNQQKESNTQVLKPKKTEPEIVTGESNTRVLKLNKAEESQIPTKLPMHQIVSANPKNTDEMRMLLTQLSLENRNTSNLFLILCWSVLTPIVAGLLIFHAGNGELGFVFLWAMMLAMAGKLYQQSTQLDKNQTALHLVNLNSAHVGMLAELLEDPDLHIRSMASIALIPLLYRLKPKDAEILDDAQRFALYNRLKLKKAKRDSLLKMAILKALESIGDADALPYVTQIVESNAVV